MEPGPPSDNIHRYDAPTFTPTFEEFRNVRAFIESPEVQKAGFDHGIVKVVCPSEWKPGMKSVNDAAKTRLAENMPVIEQTFRQEKEGLFVFVRPEHAKVMHVKVWKSKAKRKSEVMDATYEKIKKARRETGSGDVLTEDESFDETAQKYWSTLAAHKALYCADIEDTLMDPLVTIAGKAIPGITSSYLYFGAAGTTFGFHTEDADLYSINYVHEAKTGAEKRWHSIPPKYGEAFEAFARREYADTKCCKAFMRDKSLVIRPDKIRAVGIPVYQAKQGRHEMVITFPYAYHSGFNAGFNVAEARNIALPSWIRYGLSAAKCNCGECSVDPFPLHLIEEIAEKEDPAEYSVFKKYATGTYPHPNQENVAGLTGATSHDEAGQVCDP